MTCCVKGDILQFFSTFNSTDRCLNNDYNAIELGWDNRNTVRCLYLDLLSYDGCLKQ